MQMVLGVRCKHLALKDCVFSNIWNDLWQRCRDVLSPAHPEALWVPKALYHTISQNTTEVFGWAHLMV